MKNVFTLNVRMSLIALSSLVLMACGGASEKQADNQTEKQTSVKSEGQEMSKNASPSLQEKAMKIKSADASKNMKKSVAINGEKYTYEAPLIIPGVFVTHAATNENYRVTERIVVVIAKNEALALNVVQQQLEELGKVNPLASNVFEIAFDAKADMLEKYQLLKALPFVNKVELQFWQDPKAGKQAAY